MKQTILTEIGMIPEESNSIKISKKEVHFK